MKSEYVLLMFERCSIPEFKSSLPTFFKDTNRIVSSTNDFLFVTARFYFVNFHHTINILMICLWKHKSWYWELDFLLRFKTCRCNHSIFSKKSRNSKDNYKPLSILPNKSNTWKMPLQPSSRLLWWTVT